MSVIDPSHLPTDASPLSVSMDETAADAFLVTAAARTSTAFAASVAVVGRTATVTLVNPPAGPGELRVDWGDGTPIGAPLAISAGSAQHTYLSDGVFDISIAAKPTWHPTVPFGRAPLTQVIGVQAVVNWPPAPGTPLDQAAFIAAHKPH